MDRICNMCRKEEHNTTFWLEDDMGVYQLGDF
jgi:hypothetical protein